MTPVFPDLLDLIDFSLELWLPNVKWRSQQMHTLLRRWHRLLSPVQRVCSVNVFSRMIP